MKNRFSIGSLIGVILISFACTNEDQNGYFSGNSVDDMIIGKWNTSYSSRDLNNGITVFFDTITFNSNNHGYHKIHEFNSLHFSHSFQFYTEGSTLHLKYDQVEGEVLWTYSIRNDSLILKDNNIYKR
jgi:hypothetical protein